MLRVGSLKDTFTPPEKTSFRPSSPIKSCPYMPKFLLRSLLDSHIIGYVNEMKIGVRNYSCGLMERHNIQNKQDMRRKVVE